MSPGAPWVPDPSVARRSVTGSGRPLRMSSLYFQCAAMPYSARRCMAKVRICISTGLPSSPMTVVCSDWYMLNFGIATKSLNRPGTGFHRPWMIPSAA